MLPLIILKLLKYVVPAIAPFALILTVPELAPIEPLLVPVAFSTPFLKMRNVDPLRVAT